MIVVDASVAIKWIWRDEKYSDTAQKLLNAHISKQETIVVPLLLYYELSNALATKSLTHPRTIKRNLQVIFKIKLTTQTHKESELIQAALLSKQFKTSTYDMLYAVIAKRET